MENLIKNLQHKLSYTVRESANRSAGDILWKTCSGAGYRRPHIVLVAFEPLSDIRWARSSAV